MKVGSLVELIDDKWTAWDWEDVKVPVKGTIYTVREIIPSEVGWPTNEGPSILLEEIINPLHPCGIEYSFIIKRFREIQPPMDIEIGDLIKETLEI